MGSGSAPANIILVHGGFVDGSGWRGVYDLPRQDGCNVAVVQNPTLSPQGDAAATRLIIDAQDGPVVLVGHSYGGAVITEAGTDPNVAALVYVAAFAPDKDELHHPHDFDDVRQSRKEKSWQNPRPGSTTPISPRLTRALW
jgi:pimeloyl-ACP methyl ester carboxylesterase